MKLAARTPRAPNRGSPAPAVEIPLRRRGPTIWLAGQQRALAGDGVMWMAPILVVDDDSAILDMVTWALTEEGFSVVGARNGAEALGGSTRIARRWCCWT